MSKYISIIFQIFLLFTITFFVSLMLKIEVHLNIITTLILAFVFVVWLTHKHLPKLYQRKIKYIIAPYIKSIIVFPIASNLLAFIIVNDNSSLEIVFFVSVFYPFTELLLYSVFSLISVKFFINNNNLQDNNVGKYLQENLTFVEKESLGITNLSKQNFNFAEKNIIDKLIEEIPCRGKENENSLVINCDNIATNGTYDFCVLDRRVNDLRFINRELHRVYDLVVNGGYAVFVYEDLEDFEKRYFSSHGAFLLFRKLKYLLFLRLLRKVPNLNFVYYLISRGKNQVLSRTEMWGRLFFNGFDVKKQIQKDNLSYILAQKTKTPSENPSPSFSPIITLNRVSLYGNIIKIHKFRSMYPYSEFLQQKVFEEGNLSGIGKFEGDFRITKIGKIFRKYWLDELPQLLDWFRGEIKLVGIRAMSQHFFSLYNAEYQKAYFSVKPGIISPIFDESTNGFEDIQRVEYAYLISYLKNPVITDIKYLFKTIKQIISGVRSK